MSPFTRHLRPGFVRLLASHAYAYWGACAVERRFLLVGAKPTQQLSFRLVAARAVHGGNNMG